MLWTASWNVPLPLGYALLATLLVADLYFPYAYLNSLDFWWRVTLGGGWSALPVLVSGIVFSMGIKKVADTAAAMGVNLFGAVLGGVLENSVMIGGTRILALIAIAIYAMSAIALFGRRHRQTVLLR